MNTLKTLHTRVLRTVSALAFAALTGTDAGAAVLTAPASGSFTLNLDRDALSPYLGYFLAAFWDTAASNYTDPSNTGDHFVSTAGTAEISAINRVFDLTAIGNDPTGQAAQRYVKGTSANFGLDSDALTGVAGTQIGMTGVQGFYAPLWPPSGGGLVNGDFSVQYDSSRQATGQTGWYLANNMYFTMAVYDLSNLSVAYADSGNWRFSGDVLMSPENGGMLRGASLNKVGDFCLGAGSYAGCGQVSAVPVPAAAGLFASGLLGLVGAARQLRRKRQQS